MSKMADKGSTAFLIVVLILSALWFTLTYTQTVYYVPSRSMEPTLKPGDLIVIRAVSGEELLREFNEQEEKPIIVFDVPQCPKPIVHRIHRIIYDEQGRFLGFETKGDNNRRPDPYLVKPENIRGEVFLRIPLLGYIIMFVKSEEGKLLLGAVIVVLLILTIMEYVRLGRSGGSTSSSSGFYTLTGNFYLCKPARRRM